MNSLGAVLSPALLNTIPIVIEMKQNKQFPRELVEMNPESGSSISVQRTDLSISCGPEQEPQNGEKKERKRIEIKLYHSSNISHLADFHRRPRHA